MPYLPQRSTLRNCQTHGTGLPAGGTRWGKSLMPGKFREPTGKSPQQGRSPLKVVILPPAPGGASTIISESVFGARNISMWAQVPIGNCARISFFSRSGDWLSNLSALVVSFCWRRWFDQECCGFAPWLVVSVCACKVPVSLLFASSEGLTSEGKVEGNVWN